MKFSTAAILALASGISAMPWSSRATKQQAMNREDITLHIKVEQAPVKQGLVDPSKLDVCWNVCWNEIPTCPDDWYSNNMGTANEPCWTCCRAPSGEL